MRIPRVLAAGVAVAVVAGSTAVAAAAPVSLDGTWQTDGYGQYVVVQGAFLARYDTTAVSCRPAGQGRAATATGGRRRFEIADDDAVTLRLTGSTATEQVDSATSVRLLTRAVGLPGPCHRPPDRSPLGVFDTLWATFAENYPFFALHGVDWNAVRARYRPTISAATTDEQLRHTFSAMLEPLHDAHVALVADDDLVVGGGRPGTQLPGPDLDARVAALVSRVDLPSAGGTPLSTYLGGRVAVAELAGGIGYLRVSGFTGYTDADTEPANRAALSAVLDRVVTPAAVARWRGVIVDLRVNGGGSDALARDLAARFTARPYVGYAKQYRHGPADRVVWSAPQPVTVTPAPVRFDGPLAILQSGSTVSAGETFVQSLLDRSPAPVLVGQPTQGVFSDVLTRALPNGWTVLLPNERYVTDGRSYDGTGIPPTVTAPLRTSGAADPLFAAAYRALRAAR